MRGDGRIYRPIRESPIVRRRASRLMKVTIENKKREPFEFRFLERDGKVVGCEILWVES